MTIYYDNNKHSFENKWLAMINPDSGTKIRSIMKISVQLIGPNDVPNSLKINLDDEKDPNVELLLPPELNPKV